MAITITHNINPQEQIFNGLRRTKEGMLYLTTVNPNEGGTVGFSTFEEEGKSDIVPKDGTDYVEERLEFFNCHEFIGDGSTTTFTLNVNMGTFGHRLYVAIDDVIKDGNVDYTISGTTMTLVGGAPPVSSSLVIRYLPLTG